MMIVIIVLLMMTIYNSNNDDNGDDVDNDYDDDDQDDNDIDEEEREKDDKRAKVSIHSQCAAVKINVIVFQIDCLIKLSGMPDLTLTFINPRLLDDVSFHPCVRFKRWEVTLC
jgi:hypothetical protein